MVSSSDIRQILSVVASNLSRWTWPTNQDWIFSTDYMVRGAAFWLFCSILSLLPNGERGTCTTCVQFWFFRWMLSNLSLLLNKIDPLLCPDFLDQILLQLHCYALSKQSLPFRDHHLLSCEMSLFRNDFHSGPANGS